MNRIRLLLTSITLTAAASFAVPVVLAADAPAAAAPAPYAVPAGTSAYVKKAVENPERRDADRARDALRKPAELLTLSGVKPGDKVVEIASFGQYFTTLLSDVVGPKGMVYMYELPYTEARAGEASRKFVAAHPNSKYEIVDYNKIELPRNVDSVFMVLYYHDLLINKIETGAFNKKVLAALKPGGTYFIVDHNAQPGATMEEALKIHRIDPKVIRDEVTAAGFELVQESKVLANPADDRTKGPSFAPGQRGTTDQSVFVFRKPKK
jgi:predicted methyltransferase